MGRLRNLLSRLLGRGDHRPSETVIGTDERQVRGANAKDARAVHETQARRSTHPPENSSRF